MRIVRGISGVVVVCLVLASCSAPGDVRARAANPAARPGGTITIAIGEPASIDPAHASDRWGRFVVSLVCDALIQLDPITGDPVGALADSWVVSGGGRQITVKLRKGLRFHDGTPMSAEDAAFALTRVASEEEGSALADLLRPVAGWGQVHGDEEAHDEEQLRALAGARAIGPLALQISLSEPRADWYRVLAHTLSAPVPRALVARDPVGFAERPTCIGPYTLEKPWRSGDGTIVLVRSEHYYGENRAFTRGGRGYADRIVLRVTRSDDVRAGDDVAPLRGHRAGPKGARVVVAPTPYLEYIGLPVAVAPFDRRAVRIALSQAIDRAQIARSVYANARTPARGFLPPALGRIARDNACGASTPGSGARQAAAKTLADAGVDLRGVEIPVLYNPDFDNRALATLIARQWTEAFGARAKPVAVPWDDYLRRAAGRDGFTDAFRMGWEPRYVGPDAILAPLFMSSSIGRDNVTRFSDPRFDRLVARDARRAGSEEDLIVQSQRLEDIVCEQMPAIPVVFGGARYAVDVRRIDSAVPSFVDRAAGVPIVRELFVRSEP